MKPNLRGPFIGPHNELNDMSPMPFGKHRGESMQDVPVSYLNWLWHNGQKNDLNSLVGDYIRRNMDALVMEDGNLIW